MFGAALPRREKWQSIAGVLFVHMVLGFVLLRGLTVGFDRVIEQPMVLIDLRAPAPAPPPEHTQSADDREEGGAAPPDLRARAAPVVAPPPQIVIPRENPVRAAPEPNDGAATSQGAAEVAGPGTGAGGEGTGTGAGAGGNGPGGGFAVQPARKIAGEIRPQDHPRWGQAGRAQGEVAVNLLIDANGRVNGCRVVRSSGNAELDAATCRLIRERFRYEPARDASGRAVASERGWRQVWYWRERG